MAYKFNAIDNDKTKLNREMPTKRVVPNSFFTGGMDVNDLVKTNTIIQENTTINGIRKIDINLINERKINNFDKISNVTLKASIRNIGLLEPIIVRTTDTNKYIVISGHRRLSAYKELVNDLKVEKALLEKNSSDTTKVSAEIESFSSIPSLIFTIVEDDSELLGTNPKYITKQIEEEMYQAANLEARQISENAMAKNIKYFYNLIVNHPEYKSKLLNERNLTAERKATKLNMPAVISDIVTNELKFNISKGYVARMIKILDSENEYPAYYKIAMKRINNDEGINAVYNDFDMALKIYKNIQSEEKDIKQEYLDRMEKSDEPMVNIYNEVFSIKPSKNEKGRGTTDKKISMTKVEELLIAVKNKEITIDQAINKLKKM